MFSRYLAIICRNHLLKPRKNTKKWQKWQKWQKFCHFCHICQCKKLPIYYRFVLLSGADAGTSAETRGFVEIADLAVLMLLVLAEHPCEG